MAQPTAYDRSFSFTNDQAAHPSSPPPGNELDAEFNNVKTTFDQTLANLARIQRDDGALANLSVGRAQLSAEVSVGFNVPTAWAQNTQYTAVASTVFYTTKFYRAIVSHTSGTTFDATKWEVVADFSTIPSTSAAAVSFTPAGNIASSNVQSALQELDTEKALLSHTHPSTEISDSTVVGRQLLVSANTNAQLDILGIRNRYFQPGDWKYTDCITLETGWLWRDGSTYTRTTYPALFAAITISFVGVTTNGSAIVTGIPDTSNMRAGMPISGDNVSGFAATILSVDSATQITLSANATGTASSALLVAPHGVTSAVLFNVPDARGCTAVSRDDQGLRGVAGKITVAGCGVLGTRMAATGGTETHTLTSAQMPSHTHVATSVVTDPQHAHTYSQGTSGNASAIAPGHATLDGASVVNTSTVATGITVATTNATAGSGTAHNNMGPFLVCNSIVKT